MVHFFSSLQREPFSNNRVGRNALFDKVLLSKLPQNQKKYLPTAGGLLANYLIDPQRIFTDDLTRNITKLTFNMSSDIELAEERFRRDIAVLNFFFDTPIITQIQLELRTNVFDMISAIGGTLGLFTGISVITLVEVIWWFFHFSASFMKRASQRAKDAFRERSSAIKKISPKGNKSFLEKVAKQKAPINSS